MSTSSFSFSINGVVSNPFADAGVTAAAADAAAKAAASKALTQAQQQQQQRQQQRKELWNQIQLRLEMVQQQIQHLNLLHQQPQWTEDESYDIALQLLSQHILEQQYLDQQQELMQSSLAPRQQLPVAPGIPEGMPMTSGPAAPLPLIPSSASAPVNVLPPAAPAPQAVPAHALPIVASVIPVELASPSSPIPRATFLRRVRTPAANVPAVVAVTAVPPPSPLIAAQPPSAPKRPRSSLFEDDEMDFSQEELVHVEYISILRRDRSSVSLASSPRVLFGPRQKQELGQPSCKRQKIGRHVPVRQREEDWSYWHYGRGFVVAERWEAECRMGLGWRD